MEGISVLGRLDMGHDERHLPKPIDTVGNKTLLFSDVDDAALEEVRYAHAVTGGQAPLRETRGGEGGDATQFNRQCTDCMEQLDMLREDMPIMTGTIKRLKQMVQRLARREKVDAEDVQDVVELADHLLTTFNATAGTKDLEWANALMRMVESIPSARNEAIEHLRDELRRCRDASMTLDTYAPPSATELALDPTEAASYWAEVQGTQMLRVGDSKIVVRECAGDAAANLHSCIPIA